MKNMQTILVITWALAALLVIGCVYTIIAQNSNAFGINLGFNFNTVTLKEENISSEGIKTLEVSASYHEIELVATDNLDFHIIQYGAERTPEAALFNVNKDGDKLIVSAEYNNISIGMNFSRDKLKIAVPKEWLGGVELKTSSGRVVASDELTFENMSINTSSGSINLEQKLNATNLKLNSSSGSIRIADNIIVAEDFSLKSSSGSQVISGIVTCKNAKLEASSGSIRIKNKIICEGSLEASANSGTVVFESECSAKSFLAKSSSGSIKLGEMRVEMFDISSASGAVHVESLSGGGQIKSSSGSITANLINPVGDCSASSKSGSINLTIPNDLSFQFEANTTSGSIKTSFEVMYSSERKNRAVATVGLNPSTEIKAEASSGSIRVNQK